MSRPATSTTPTSTPTAYGVCREHRENTGSRVSLVSGRIYAVCEGNVRNWSGREDLNLRHPAPKAGALPGCATPRFPFTPTSQPPTSEEHRTDERSRSHRQARAHRTDDRRRSHRRSKPLRARASSRSWFGGSRASRTAAERPHSARRCRESPEARRGCAATPSRPPSAQWRRRRGVAGRPPRCRE